MAVDLDVTTATNQIEVALRDTIALALRRRYPDVGDNAGLRAFPTRGASGTPTLDEANVELVPVGGTTVYRWNATSQAADDDSLVITPTDRLNEGLPGRWLATSALATGGFLDTVRIFEGEETEEAILDKLLGQIPSCMVVWRGEDHRLKSANPGALYEFMVDFDIFVSSKSLRRGNEALLGSPVADEVDLDPGVLNGIGRLKKVVAGSNLGIGDGVDYVMPGRHTPKIQSLSEGQFIHALAIKVKASIHIPDPEGEDFPLTGIGGYGMTLQRRLMTQADDNTLTVQREVGDPDPIPQPCLAPANFHATDAGGRQINSSWDQVQGADGYRVFYSTGLSHEIRDPTTTSELSPVFSPGNVGVYVVAFNASGNSSPTATITIDLS